MITAFDLHIHTHFSPCSNMSPLLVLQASSSAGLNAIAITDHNTTAGAQAAHAIWKSDPGRFPGLRIFMGIEFRTQYGEFNAVFLDHDDCRAFEALKRDPKGRFYFTELVQTVSAMKAAGKDVMVGLNHPISLSRFNKRGGFDFDGALGDGAFRSMRSLLTFFDWVEINGMNLLPEESAAAKKLAMEYDRPLLFNSDSHWWRMIGRYSTRTAFATPREAIIAAQNGDESALDLPRDISYGRSLYYRTKSALWRDLKKAGLR